MATDDRPTSRLCIVSPLTWTTCNPPTVMRLTRNPLCWKARQPSTTNCSVSCPPFGVTSSLSQNFVMSSLCSVHPFSLARLHRVSQSLFRKPSFLCHRVGVICQAFSTLDSMCFFAGSQNAMCCSKNIPDFSLLEPSLFQKKFSFVADFSTAEGHRPIGHSTF